MRAITTDCPPELREFLSLVVWLALTVHCINWLLSAVDQCPLEAGDWVSNGIVVERQVSGSLTEACVVQVEWADGSESYVAASKLERE